MADKIKEGAFKGMTKDQVSKLPNHQYSAMKKSYSEKKEKKKREGMSLLEKVSNALGGS